MLLTIIENLILLYVILHVVFLALYFIYVVIMLTVILPFNCLKKLSIQKGIKSTQIIYIF